MRIALLLALLATAWLVPSSTHAQAPDNGQLADAWMLHLEDELDTRTGVGNYLGAPAALLDGVLFGVLAVAMAEHDRLTSALLAGAATMWFGAGIGYYATSDPEDAHMTYAAMVGAALLFSSAIPLAEPLRCRMPFGHESSCMDSTARGENRPILGVLGGTGIAISLLMLGTVILASPPRVADLRVGFGALSPEDRRARLLSHLQFRERRRRTFGITGAVIYGVSAVALAVLAASSESPDARALGGITAAWFGATSLGTTVTLLVETPDSERLLAGEFPDD